jgi:hypothetical protein
MFTMVSSWFDGDVAAARDAGDDERWVVEGYYARTRTMREDLGWLLRGLGRLVAARRGRPVAGSIATRPEQRRPAVGRGRSGSHRTENARFA